MRLAKAIILAFALIWSAALPAAAAGEAPEANVTLTGQITYTEKIPLPPDAHLIVRLIDISRHDTRPTVEAQAPIASTGKIPLQFTLRFNPASIIPAHRYGLDVTITSGDQIWFRTSEPYPVAPLQPEAAIAITVRFVGTITNMPTRQPPAAPTGADLLDAHWRVTAIDGDAVPANPEITLMITGDSRVGGRGGCNSYFAQADLDGAKLAFSPVAATRMMCAAPVMANETAFFNALPTVASYAVNGTALSLFDVSGKTVLALTSAAP